MLNCKQKIKHLKLNPDHKAYLLTSTQYASELKICELAQGYNKLIRKSDGEEYMISPFAPVNLPLLDKSQIVDDNDPNLLADPKIGKRPYKRRETQPGTTTENNGPSGREDSNSQEENQR